MMSKMVSTVLSAGLLMAVMGLAAGCVSTQSSTTDAEQVAGEEEVDVGYGKQKRGEVTGAVATVDAEDAQRRRVATHLSDLIQGNVAGVQVFPASGGGLRVRIRGINTFYGDTEPLYILDGVPVQPGANAVRLSGTGSLAVSRNAMMADRKAKKCNTSLHTSTGT